MNAPPRDAWSLHAGGPAALTCRIAALAVAAAGVALMLLAAPRVPYADAWRLYAKLLEQPFLAGVSSADNGHREIVPNAVRWIEVHLLGGDQTLGIVLGALLAIAAAAVWLRTIARTQLPTATRAAASLIAVLGLFWLGNERALAHAHESVRVYLIVLCLMLALARIADGRVDARAAAGAAALALLATLTFGSGIASFGAIAIVMALGGATRAAWGVWAAGLAVALALYLGGASAAVTGTLSFDPIGQAVVLVRWLASPFVYVFWPLLDPAIAAQLPGAPLRAAAIAAADAFTTRYGPVRTSLMPQALIGASGLACLLIASGRAWRAPAATVPARRAALGVAWFGLGVGAVIAVSRSAYFADFPEQLQAPRYLPWSSLFWAGLLCAALLAPGRRSRPSIALLAAAALAPSSLWMAELALSMQRAAERTATAAVVGLVPDSQPLGETVAAELAAALPALRRDSLGPYRWPEARCLGRRLREDAIDRLDMREPAMSTSANRIGAAGRLIRFELTEPAQGRLLIVDAAGVLRGLAVRDRARGRGTWEGWLAPDPDSATVVPTIARRVGTPLCAPL
ncbi:MAG TPA: hypothetical protein VMR06_08825 [Dokdonella sp.]|uniref:hypothetical protein n=1 Tax=Dokdonella sp. TaxID=2291710 RepID=UPI002C98F4F3|nr:hypothetical protein [Dokdonella sp.]HUD42085.1 hypothetical protein [Dokdonella sp.]